MLNSKLSDKMIKRDIILFVCLCSIIFVMISGLLFDLRFITLLKRILFSLAIVVMFGSLIGVIIEKYIYMVEPSIKKDKLNDKPLDPLQRGKELESQENERL